MPAITPVNKHWHWAQPTPLIPVHEDALKRVYEIIPKGPDLVVEAAGPIEAVKLMVDLRRRGTRWNVFGITTPEKFELEGGPTHFLEGRMDASFGTNPLAMSKSIRLMETGLVNTERIISHCFPLEEMHQALRLWVRLIATRSSSTHESHRQYCARSTDVVGLSTAGAGSRSGADTNGCGWHLRHGLGNDSGMGAYDPSQYTGA